MSHAANPEVVPGGEPAALGTPEITEANTSAGGPADGSDLPSGQAPANTTSQPEKTEPEEPKKAEGVEPPAAAAAAEREAPADDDPFAEFEGRVPENKDKTYYEELFKTDKWRTVPHAARNEIFALTEQVAQKDAVLNAVGGDAMLATIKPVTAVLSNPNPTNEEVEQAFDAIDSHNPKVMESLGAKFTKNWVQEVLSNPMQNLSPVVQVLLRQTFQTNDYDLGRIMELVQLDLAVDAAGEKLLDTDYARQAFERLGGIPTFKYQRELASRDAELQKLRQSGYGQSPQAQQNTDTAKSSDFTQIETDIEMAVMTEVTPLLDKIGKPGEPLYELAKDAAKYRLRSAQEMQNIRNFAKSGAYKTADGKFTQGVDSNAKFLTNRIFASVLKELKGVQSGRRAAGAAPAPKTKANPAGQPSNTQTTGQQPTQPTNNSQQPTAPANVSQVKSVEDFAASTAARIKAQVADEKAARQVASGK